MRYFVVFVALLVIAALLAGWTWDEDSFRAVAEGSTIIC